MDDYIPAIPAVRGCGTRKMGGIYVETGFAPPGQGRPVEDFLLCPPIPTTGFDIPARGVTLWEVEGVTHIIDRIGMEGYPNVLDFVEEVRRFGLSRRLQASLDFSKLGPGSRILVVHDRAIIEDWEEYNLKEVLCPKDFEHGHSDFCIGTWRYDLTDTVSGEDAERWAKELPGLDVREMPSFRYSGHRRPEGVKPEYTQGIFGSFPISRLVVVDGSETSEANLRKAAAAALPAVMVAE